MGTLNEVRTAAGLCIWHAQRCYYSVCSRSVSARNNPSSIKQKFWSRFFRFYSDLGRTMCSLRTGRRLSLGFFYLFIFFVQIWDTRKSESIIRKPTKAACAIWWSSNVSNISKFRPILRFFRGYHFCPRTERVQRTASEPVWNEEIFWRHLGESQGCGVSNGVLGFWWISSVRNAK